MASLVVQPPLFYAARENRVEMCKMLIEELGVYAAQRDAKGKDAKFFVKDNDMLYEWEGLL